MIDLHCHLLPGIDDGAPNLDTSLAMARIAVADGITVTACTPHIYPGMYQNTGPAIRQAVSELQAHLDEAGVSLRLTYGADTHIAPDLVAGLRDGRVPSLHG
ncbi:MAG TPA: capsular biosynthesis protein, partial [Candidatus Competibacteraceae bacterium]|nr:capsular biosynthesis protein [Candidatus Competibacteraceae bacterium]